MAQTESIRVGQNADSCERREWVSDTVAVQHLSQVSSRGLHAPAAAAAAANDDA